MGLFSQRTRSVDRRDRDYVLAGCPLVAQDDQVVLVDVTVRLSMADPAEGEPPAAYDPAREDAVHAVCVVVLRLLAVGVASDELLVGRAHVTEAIEQGLAFAPIGPGLTARVLEVEVSPYDAARATYDHEFRVVGA